MASGRSKLPHVDSKVPATPFTKSYGDSSDKEFGDSISHPTSTNTKASSDSSLESSSSGSDKSSSTSTSTPVTFQHLKPPSKPTVPRNVRKENLSVCVDVEPTMSDIPKSVPPSAAQDRPGDLSSDIKAVNNTVGSHNASEPGSTTPGAAEITRLEDKAKPGNTVGENLAPPTPRSNTPSQQSVLSIHDQQLRDVNEHRHANQLEPAATVQRKTTLNTCTWDLKRKDLYSGIWDQGSICKQVRSITFTIPVGCRKGKDPQISLWVIPCENEQSRHVSIDGELLIKRGCSRYKWLVEYCRCSVLLSVKVSNPLDSSEVGAAEGEFDIEPSEHNNDHRTRVRLHDVLDHQLVFYGKNISKFTFQATIKLLEHQVRQEEEVLPYQCKPYEGYLDIVPSSE